MEADTNCDRLINKEATSCCLNIKKRLTSELNELFKEGDRLQEEVKKQLDSIGWKIKELL